MVQHRASWCFCGERVFGPWSITSLGTRGAPKVIRDSLQHAIALRRSMVHEPAVEPMCTFRPTCIAPRRQLQGGPVRIGVFDSHQSNGPKPHRFCDLLLRRTPDVSSHCPKATSAIVFMSTNTPYLLGVLRVCHAALHWQLPMERHVE